MIDWARIDELKAEVGEDAVAEVVEIFFEEVDEAMAALGSAGTPDALADALHFLKGSAQNVGMSDVAGACAAQEVDVRAGRRTAVDLPAIQTALRSARTELIQRLP